MSALTFDKDEDYYGILEIEMTATTEEIKKAYRKVSIKYHPDKVKGDAKLIEKFHLAKKASQILTDEGLRSGYDAVLEARLKAKQRTAAMSDRSRKVKEDLEEREREHAKRQKRQEKAESDVMDEIDRLKKERQRRKEEKESWADQWASNAPKEKDKKSDAPLPILKASWNDAVGSYSKERLNYFFSMFGDVQHIVIQGSAALITFSNIHSALAASFMTQMGDTNNPLKVSWPEKRPKDVKESSMTAAFGLLPKPTMSMEEFQSFERMVLDKLVKAAEA
ncbi:dnaJ [Planoprotostelium fungivorum]|uniref:DnaJ n=1 Tax=Planoprotostelium fungivorum TaxID=1890364 RepID=A0A2P6NWF9_9EUKA|nr:dnaJ [Planoprotostelium fungivorum]